MQRVQNQLTLTFPKRYLRKFEQRYRGYYRREAEKRRIKKPHNNLADVIDRCKQVMPLANRLYCCALREEIDAGLCQRCPHYEPEPLAYALFRRGWKRNEVSKQGLQKPHWLVRKHGSQLWLLQRVRHHSLSDKKRKIGLKSLQHQLSKNFRSLSAIIFHDCVCYKCFNHLTFSLPCSPLCLWLSWLLLFYPL